MGVPMVEPRKKKLKTGFIKSWPLFVNGLSSQEEDSTLLFWLKKPRKFLAVPSIGPLSVSSLYALGIIMVDLRKRKKFMSGLRLLDQAFSSNTIPPNIGGYQIKEVTNILF